MTKSVISSLLAFPLFLSSLAPNVMAAATEDLKSSLKQACQTDIQQFCSNVTPGQGRVMACLKSYEDKLSSSCKQQWQSVKSEWHKAMKGAHAACAGDIQKFCSSVDTPRDIKNCLDEHSTDLSSTCKSFRQSNQDNQGNKTQS